MKTGPAVADNFVPIKADHNMPAKVTNRHGRFMYSSPVDELLDRSSCSGHHDRSFDSTTSDSSDGSVGEFANSEFRQRKLHVDINSGNYKLSNYVSLS